MRCKTLYFVFFLFAILPISSVLGKIGDPPPFTKDNISYQSHRHTVWATKVAPVGYRYTQVTQLPT